MSKGVKGRLAARRDANEPGIVADLRMIGAAVYLIDEPADLLIFFRGRWYVLEVKVPGDGRLTQSQKETRKELGREAIPVVETFTEAAREIGARIR